MTHLFNYFHPKPPILFIGIVFLTSLVVGCYGEIHLTDNDSEESTPLNTESVARGKTIFSKNCSRCHGEDAKGTGPDAKTLDTQPADLVSRGTRVSIRGIRAIIATPHYSERLIAETVYYGKNKMPSWKEKLSEEDIHDVISYLKNRMVEEDKVAPQ